jgi:hypothetical protein
MHSVAVQEENEMNCFLSYVRIPLFNRPFYTASDARMNVNDEWKESRSVLGYFKLATVQIVSWRD